MAQWASGLAVTPVGDLGGGRTCGEEGGRLLELCAGQGLLVVQNAGTEECAGAVTLLQGGSLGEGLQHAVREGLCDRGTGSRRQAAHSTPPSRMSTMAPPICRLAFHMDTFVMKMPQ